MRGGQNDHGSTIFRADVIVQNLPFGSATHRNGVGFVRLGNPFFAHLAILTDARIIIKARGVDGAENTVGVTATQ